MIILSILIPTIPERSETSFAEFIKEIYKQIGECNAWSKVEILYDDTPRGVITTGEKRNRLKNRAIAKYIWFVDDDDMILPGAINAILEAAKTDCDCMAINGIMTYDGTRETQWFIALNNPYSAEIRDGKEIYLRYPNHITPMKRELALQCQFPDQNNFEDKAWADCLKAKGVLKTETKIDIPVYHYRYQTYNKTYV